MAVYLVTGTPGSGKTLHAIWMVHNNAIFKGREVYQHGIRELALPWHTLADPKKWMDIPDGAVVVIDECWEHFPPRKPSAEVPDYIAKMATHRHRGIDIVLITQGPHQIDTFVKELVNPHIHLLRAFGFQGAQVYRGSKLLSVRSKTDLKDADSARWSYPKEVFSYYKSAEVHTHKRTLPKSVKWVALLVVLIPAAAWYTYKGLIQMGAPTPAEAAKKAAQGGGTAAALPALPPGQSRYVNGVEQNASGMLAASYSPTIAGQPWTAPRYEQFNQAVRAPIPRACIAGIKQQRRTCTCYTDEAEIITAQVDACESIVRGEFVLDMVAIGQLAHAPAARPYNLDKGMQNQGVKPGSLLPVASGKPGVLPPQAAPTSPTFSIISLDGARGLLDRPLGGAANGR